MNNATMKKITSHYQSAIGGDMEKTHVEEWDMDIYYRKTYSFKDEAQIIAMQSEGKMVEALVESIIVKARDVEGKRIFADADRVTLLNEADPAVITKVCNEINNAKYRASIDDASKE